jgi:hypothetical protein
MSDPRKLDEKTQEARDDIRDAVHVARPVIKSILGFLIYLRFGPPPSLSSADPDGEVTRANETAEAFIKNLEREL